MFVRPVSNRLTSALLGLVLSAPGDAASVPEAASASYVAGGQIAVKPGQSLNDIAIAVTQSLARASRALFDANPNAFMSHDPSRLRLGSTLTVPPLDKTGAPVASAASGAAQSNMNTAAVSSGNAGNAASATTQAAPTSATQAEYPARPVSPPKQTRRHQCLLLTHKQARSRVRKQVHRRSQRAPDTLGPAQSSLPATPQPVPQRRRPRSRAQVSSLQQLLALKNRMLMELQKNGIGSSPASTQNAASTNGAQPAAGASSAAAQAGHGNSQASAQTNAGISQTRLSVAIAIGAALVVLLAAMRSRRRKRERLAAAQAADDQTPPIVPPKTSLARGTMPSQDQQDDEATQHVSMFFDAGRRAMESEAAEQAAGEQLSATERTHALEEEQADAAGIVAEREAADRAMAGDADAAAFEAPHADHVEAESADTLSETHLHTTAETSDPEPLPTANHDSFGSVTTVASLAAAAELGADALPRTPLDEAPQSEEPSRIPLADAPQPEELPRAPIGDAHQPEETPRTLHWDDEPLPDALAEPPEPSALPIAVTPGIAPSDEHDDTVAPLIDFAHEAHAPLEALESPTFAPLGLPPANELGELSFDTRDELRDADYDQPLAHLPVAPAGAPAQNEIPRDALDAFGGLDMPLPPRVESADDRIHVPASLTTQPVASPQSTAQQAVAPLGAAGFGVLKLDFDLELPPSPTQPIPAFTATELSRIARNKLDLAAEYIELGDLSGAHTLINEVIEANDPATRTEARALLSTLAPLS